VRATDSNHIAPSKEPQSGESQVIVVHGSVGYWPGCNDFVANLAVRGAQATTIRGWEVKRTADKIVAARRAGTQAGPLVLVGYSRGANDALRLARRLQASDIPVTKLVLLETAANDSVPANVEACLNVYQSQTDDWLPAFRGVPVTVESAGTQLVNYNLRFHDEGVARADLNHFTVCKNYSVLGMVTEHVTAALRTNEAAIEPEPQVASTRAGVDERFLPFD
jgi:pimeloyl-ACP methyl ester carboxylesterase